MNNQEQEEQAERTPIFRLDVPLHQLLTKPTEAPVLPLQALAGEEPLPDPVYPSRPGVTYESDRDWIKFKALRHWRALGVPYFKSQWLPGDFHPIIAYFFTEWKCNLNCEYCWAFDNRVKGMTESTARRSIDWLHSVGCRLLALMGGEPLLRPGFVHKVVHYAAKKDFLVYLPTNGRLMRPEVIDRLGDAGVGTVNLAVDCVGEKRGLPKALDPIRPYFDYLLKKQRQYGYTIFLNVCITRNNMEDVKQLTEIAHDNNLGIDFHIVESPMIEQDHFSRLDENNAFLRPEDYPKVDDLLDWLIEKHRLGYKIVNQKRRLEQMKEFMRGGIEPWGCRAGQNTLIIRVDGTLAPCFPMYSATYDWGSVGNHKFEKRELDKMKNSCEQHCFSTLNHIVSYCYNTSRVIRWLVKQELNGFREATGTIE